MLKLNIPKIKESDELIIANKELAFQNLEKEKLAAELIIARTALAFQDEEKGKRAAELGIANIELAFQDEEKGKRAAELGIANIELAFQDEEKEKRAAELSIANRELAFQNNEKEKRAAELSIANIELAYQNGEKEKRAEELTIANKELAFQNKVKEKRAEELVIANKELAYQNDEKEKRAAELSIVNKELAFLNNEKEKRAAELSIANIELAFQNDEKEKRAAELVIANTELAFQNKVKEKRAEELVIANKELAFQNDEKEKRAAELSIANKELAFQNKEKEKRAAELSIANIELAFQNDEKEKRAAELVIANKELAFQNDEKEKRAIEKEKRAAELIIANKELAFQNEEKEKRAAELIIANNELVFQNQEKEKTEKERIQSERRLARAQQVAHMGNWELDFAMNIVLLSDEACRIYGLLPAQNRQPFESWLSFIHTQDLDFVSKELKESRNALRNFSFYYRIVPDKGSIRYIYSEGKIEFALNGEPTGLYGIAHDVTEIKLAETERTKMVNDLMLRNKDLEQFGYIVSHNLRGPVANILGATIGLNHSGLSTEKKDMIRLGLNESVAKLDDVIKDLNNILQVKRTINETKERVCFSKLVDDIKTSIKNVIDSNKIEIKYDFSEMDGFLTLKSYLYSIFYNLISNSIKYRQEKVRSIIEVKSHVQKNCIELIFTDNGMGIDLEKRGDQVFGLYKRFHTTIEGKGMGLFMVKTQVEALGGKINIRSAINQGTEFKIEFEI